MRVTHQVEPSEAAFLGVTVPHLYLTQISKIQEIKAFIPIRIVGHFVKRHSTIKSMAGGKKLWQEQPFSSDLYTVSCS